MFARTEYDRRYEKDFSVNLAVYGDFPCKIDLSTRKEAIVFSNNPNVKWPREQRSS